MDDILVEGVSVYDRREVHHHCTVEIWSNSVTGETSIGWWEETDGDIRTETETATEE